MMPKKLRRLPQSFATLLLLVASGSLLSIGCRARAPALAEIPDCSLDRVESGVEEVLDHVVAAKKAAGKGDAPRSAESVEEAIEDAGGSTDGPAPADASSSDSADESARAAMEALVSAERSLRRLLDFHIPLARAREALARGSRYARLGRTEEASAEIDTLEEILLEISRTGEGPVSEAMQGSLAKVAEARVALGRRSADANEVLERLRHEMEGLTNRSDLLLRRSP